MDVIYPSKESRSLSDLKDGEVGYCPELRVGSSGGISYLRIDLDETIIKRPALGHLDQQPR